ncbi:hypothetical protein [Planctellipticum variicoloris]|uniref:hypothetical protein n=1 Tax=Planctellipticum variicoloris TaxID=3064265 RepID=UPI00301344D7|nr:hypothetical protein SH412_000735 [Planctomycetaceae bacterium SH412]
MLQNWKVAAAIVAVLTVGAAVAEAKIYCESYWIELPGVDRYGNLSWCGHLTGGGIVKTCYNTRTRCMTATVRGQVTNESCRAQCYTDIVDAYQTMNSYSGCIVKSRYFVTRGGSATGCASLKNCMSGPPA